MGWMYNTLKKKDVFVSKIVSSRLRDTIEYFAIWFNTETQKWQEENLEWFQPPRRKH